MSFPVGFDSESYFQRRQGSRPLRPFPVVKTTPSERALMYGVLRAQADKLIKEPDGVLRYGLARYGFKKEAADVAGRLLDVFCADQQQNGTIHECYHAETGAPIMKPGFLSWNLLAIRIVNDLDTGSDPAWIASE